MEFRDWSTLVTPLLRSAWRAAVALFERHPSRIALSGVLLLAAIITGNLYVVRTKQYQAIVSTTVRAQGEDTPQRFKVLEAFIMSTIDPTLTHLIANARISPDFSAHLTGMHDVLSKRTLPPSPTDVVSTTASHGTLLTSTPVKLSIPDYITTASQQPLEDAILTDDADNGYLFFPLNLLRSSLTDYPKIFAESQNDTFSPTLTAAVAKDSSIADDIDVSRKLVPLMQPFTAVKLFEPNESLNHLVADVTPVQVYYITKNGVNRIINNTDRTEQRAVYRNMFRSSTFFPSRPYYVAAFKKIPPPRTLESVNGLTSESFYVSQPYLDIGGFGVVITLARPVSYPGHSSAVICFDLRVRLENDVVFHLKQRLESFGTTPREVTCHIGFRNNIDCNQDRGSDMAFPLKHELESLLADSMVHGELSKVVGDISILNDQTKRTGADLAGVFDVFTYPAEILIGYNAQPITFAIPISSPRAPGGNELVAQFMISSLNLERFRQITSLLGLTSVSLLGSAFFVVLFSWQGEMRTRRSYEEAFQKVDRVLYGAPTAYCRLSARDSVVDCNTAFCGLLKMPADNESVELIRGQTFESLLAPRSKTTYQDVQERRRTGQEVAPYTVYFTCVDKSEVEARVTSGVIPGHTPRELPETFGIIITAPRSTS